MEKSLSEMTLEELWQLFPIILQEHNPEYLKWYEAEREEIIIQLGEANIKRISHIGSTSVIGLLAKPTIDILLEVDKTYDIKQLRDILLHHGWMLMAAQECPEMRLDFNKGYTPEGFAEKVYHLHVRHYGDWNELYFRDYLMEHKEAAEEYAQLKLDLLKKYRNNRDAYTNSKSEFVMKYTEKARECYGDRYQPKE